MAAAVFAGWTLWFHAESAANRYVHWDAPHHLLTLVAVPVLIAMQTTWFCALAPLCDNRMKRSALWLGVPIAAAVLFVPSWHLAVLWWRLV